MPQAITEFFNGGLVTSRHPALLQPGELQRADDTVYREKDPAIWRAPGRTVYNSAAIAATAIKGLAHLTFDGARTDQLIAFNGTNLYRSNFTAITGTFAEIAGPGQIAGAVTALTTFTATTGQPFHTDIVGARVYGASVPSGTVVNAISGTPVNGHYPAIVVSQTITGATSLSFEWGIVQTLQDNGDEILDVAQWDSTYFTWFGHGIPYRLSWRYRPTLPSSTSLTDILNMRPMGLKEVIEAPTVTQVAASGWNVTLGAGYYWFFITEIFAPGGDVGAAERNPLLASELIESAYLAADPTASDPSSAVGRPIGVNITNVTNQGVQIVFPAVRNNGVDGRLATHWAAYMYGPTQDSRTVPSLAQFRRVATYAMTQYTAGLSKTLQDAQFVQTFVPSVQVAGDGVSNFTSPANALGHSDGVPARAKSGSSTDGSEQQEPAVVKLSAWKDWYLGTDPITTTPWDVRGIVGIEVGVNGAADPGGNAGRTAGYYFHVDTATKHTPLGFGEFGSDNYHVNVHGGSSDTMGVSWVTTDMTSISVSIGKTGTGARQRLKLDSVFLKFYFTGTTINLEGPAYRVVTYRDQIGTTVNEPVNLPPPECSTGDIWNGSLVVNDMGNEGTIRYSLPNKPEAFPKPYVLKFNTRKKDKVTFIRSLGQILIVGMRDSIKRVNYLPRETDTDFQQGIAHEDLATDHGIPGPLAAVKFDMPGAGPVIIYASYNGIFLTDGITTRPANVDLDWSGTVNTANLASCVFRVYPREKWLVLYCNPIGANHTKNTVAYIFSYAQDKVKDGGFLPCTGPITVSGRSSCETTINGVPYLFTGHESNGKVYVEDSGVTIPSGYQVHNLVSTLTAATLNPLIRTRRIFPAGIERDAREERIYLLFSKYGATVTAASCITTKDSITVTSSNLFGSVVVGSRITGAGIEPGTIVITKPDNNTVTLSHAANTTGSAISMAFDTGVIAVTIRGSSLSEDVATLETIYVSTIIGDLISAHPDNMKQGLELQIEKVVLPDTSTVDLGVNMRLHQFTYMVSDMGPEATRTTS